MIKYGNKLLVCSHDLIFAGFKKKSNISYYRFLRQMVRYNICDYYDRKNNIFIVKNKKLFFKRLKENGVDLKKLKVKE